ncbi:hypothetical protein [Streptomyces sp. NPDC054863]
MRRAVAWLKSNPWMYAVPLFLALTLATGFPGVGDSWLGDVLRTAAIVCASAGVQLYLRGRDAGVLDIPKYQLAALEEMLKRGEAPEGEEGRRAMGALVARRRQQARYRRPAQAVVLLLVAGIGVLLCVALAPPLSILGGAGAAALIGHTLWEARKVRTRLDRMEQALAGSGR